MQKTTSILTTIFVLSYCFLFLANCDNNSVHPGNGSEGELLLISPTQIYKNDGLSIIAKNFGKDGLLNTKTSTIEQITFSGAEFSEQSIYIKRGVGALFTTHISNSMPEIKVTLSNASRTIKILDKRNFATISGGTLSSDQLNWTKERPYLIESDFTVQAGDELRIEAGAVVRLKNKVNIIIKGRLEAHGTAEHPITFMADSKNEPWGGLVFEDATAGLRYCIFTQGGADESRIIGHSESQAVVRADRSFLEVNSCFLHDNPGKAFGSRESELYIRDCLTTRCDTGGEFLSSSVNISNCHIMDIPNDDGTFVDDDNDGLYIVGVHPTISRPSVIDSTFIITGKDDAIDHNSAKLEIKNSWLEGFLHEGLAASNSQTVSLYNTLIKNCQQGVEAGYGSPNVVVDQCLIMDNEVGVRFGDSYDWGCTGKITVTNSIIQNNEKNVYNFDLLIQAVREDSIEISYSLINDTTYMKENNLIHNTAEFNEFYLLEANSPGKNAGTMGQDVGLTQNPYLN